MWCRTSYMYMYKKSGVYHLSSIYMHAYSKARLVFSKGYQL